MKVDTYKCDGCGAVKADRNHWFLVESGDTHFTSRAWDYPQGNIEDDDHFCGGSCLLAAFQKWLTKQQKGNPA